MKPYLKKTIKKVILSYNSKFGDEKLCKCGHTYYRHFDSYENMNPIGCKYCKCRKFVLEKSVKEAL